MSTQACILTLLILPATITPMSEEQRIALKMSEEQRIALNTAYDGRDHQESAFDALVENVREWSRSGDPVGDPPDYEALLADPQRHRGEVYRVTGELRQQRRLPEPHEAVEEWFIGEVDRAMLVYVINADADRSFRDGESVAITARFYKRSTFTARDGQVRDYPAFVGAFAETGRSPAVSATVLWLMVPAVAIMLLLFAFLLVRVRSSSGGQKVGGHRLPTESSSMEAEAVDLPDDPAGALAELRRRAEADR